MKSWLVGVFMLVASVASAQTLHDQQIADILAAQPTWTVADAEAWVARYPRPTVTSAPQFAVGSLYQWDGTADVLRVLAVLHNSQGVPLVVGEFICLMGKATLEPYAFLAVVGAPSDRWRVVTAPKACGVRTLADGAGAAR